MLIRSVGFKYTYILACAIDICVYSCLIKLELDEASFIVVIVVHFIVQSAWLVIFSNVCLLIFGDIIGESIYSYCWGFFAITNFTQYFLAINIPNVVEFFKTHISSNLLPVNTYKIYFYPAILLSAICIVVCSVSKLQGRWENSLKLLSFKCE